MNMNNLGVKNQQVRRTSYSSHENLRMNRKLETWQERVGSDARKSRSVRAPSREVDKASGNQAQARIQRGPPMAGDPQIWCPPREQQWG